MATCLFPRQDPQLSGDEIGQQLLAQRYERLSLRISCNYAGCKRLDYKIKCSQDLVWWDQYWDASENARIEVRHGCANSMPGNPCSSFRTIKGEGYEKGCGPTWPKPDEQAPSTAKPSCLAAANQPMLPNVSAPAIDDIALLQPVARKPFGITQFHSCNA